MFFHHRQSEAIKFTCYRTLAGDITLGDLTTVLPFGNTVDTITIKGVYILEALEHAVAEYNPQAPSGEFLQLSGRSIHRARTCSVWLPHLDLCSCWQITILRH